MSLNFIPHAPSEAGVVELGDCISSALGGGVPRDVAIYCNEAGDSLIVSPYASKEDADREMSIGLEAVRHWHQELQQGTLKALVEHPDTGAFRRVPRHYWLHRAPYETRLSIPDDIPTTGYDDSMADRPILISETDLPVWKAVVDKLRASLAVPAANEQRRLSRRAKRVTVPQRLLGDALMQLSKAGKLDAERGHSAKALHASYVDYLRRTNKSAVPMKLTAFKKWLARFRNGEHSKGYWQPE